MAAHPIASAAFAAACSAGRRPAPIDDGLVAESAVYSTLQAGPEFAAWRAGRPVARTGRTTARRSTCARDGDELHVILVPPRGAQRARPRHAGRAGATPSGSCGPTRRSAASTSGGAGPSFCAGGDLDEFGSFPDPATAHLVRLQQSAGRAIAAVADRVTVHLHGACFGSGIELPAFAAEVVADPSTVIALPEVSLGLVPGAGGTVSLPRRIGRQRTAWLGLTGAQIDAATALDWGLVDRVQPA